MAIFLFFAALDFRDPIWQFWIGVGSLGLSAVAIAVTLIVTVRNRQKKVLTYEVVSNTSVVNVDNDVGEDLKLLLDGQIVTKVRLHVIKLVNAGNIAISSDDYPHQLSFRFDSPPYPHPLIRCGVHRTEPEHLLPEHQRRELLSIDTPGETLMTLKPPLLNPRQAIFLKVLLLAEHRDSTTMTVIGQMKDGAIKAYTTPPPRRTRRVVVAAILIAFALGLLISNSVGVIAGFTQGVCAFGSIQDGGSTSFYTLASKEAQRYAERCPSQIAHIEVSQSSSGTGLSDLEHASLHIANSEVRSPYADLVDHQVAVIVFALFLNKSVTHLSSLSSAQIRQIYSGVDTFWDQVDPNAPHLPIKIIGRTATSGAHATFVRYVLGGNEPPPPAGTTIVDRSTEVVSAVATTPGAIGYADLGDANGSVTVLAINQSAPTAPLIEKGVYPFWTIEHMYTRQNPDALAISFITYVMQDLQTTDTFIRLSAMDSTVLASHE